MSVARVFGLDAHSALPLRFLAALSLDRNKSTNPNSNPSLSPP